MVRDTLVGLLTITGMMSSCINWSKLAENTGLNELDLACFIAAIKADHWHCQYMRVLRANNTHETRGWPERDPGRAPDESSDLPKVEIIGKYGLSLSQAELSWH